MVRSLCSAEQGGALRDAVAAVRRELSERIAADDAGREVPQSEVTALLAAAVRLYAACSEDPYGAATLAELALTPTEACTVAAALLRSQSLTPFEFGIWYSSSRVGSVADRDT